MAWQRYYINAEKLFDINEGEEDVCMMYDSKVPPHGGIREEWTTVGMKNGTAKILFVEYRKQDDDPDGVWEAFGMKAETSYSFTVNAEEADLDKLFVYTLYNDGSLGVGFDIDTQKAEAILVFAESQELKAVELMKAVQKAKEVYLVRGPVGDVVKDDLLKGVDDVLCLAFLNL